MRVAEGIQMEHVRGCEVTMRRLPLIFLGTAALATVVTAGATYFYSLIAHGNGWVDWGTAGRMGLVLGIVMTLIGQKKPRQGNGSSPDR